MEAFLSSIYKENPSDNLKRKSYLDHIHVNDLVLSTFVVWDSQKDHGSFIR